jgi:hypothetical protein
MTDRSPDEQHNREKKMSASKIVAAMIAVACLQAMGCGEKGSKIASAGKNHPAFGPNAGNSPARLQAVMNTRGRFLPNSAGFQIDWVDPQGPAARLQDPTLPGQIVCLEPGDIVIRAQGRPLDGIETLCRLLNEAHRFNNGIAELMVINHRDGRIQRLFCRPEVVSLPVASGQPTPSGPPVTTPVPDVARFVPENRPPVMDDRDLRAAEREIEMEGLRRERQIEAERQEYERKRWEEDAESQRRLNKIR